jgi:G:T-mismatch repair DNA endonuclease (very short patch repair protein)
LAAVKQYGRALQFIQEQTPELCLAAVQQNGYALQFVTECKLKEKIRLELNL